MGILQGLERRLRGAVDTTFARIFGGSVQPAEVAAALQHEAAIHVTHQDGRAIAPNRFTVELGPSDSAHVGDDVRRVSSALSAVMGDYVRDQGWDTFADVQVTLRESERLHTGQFRISSLVDPGVAGRQASNGYDAPLAVAPSRQGGPVQPGPVVSPPAYQPSPIQPARQYPSANPPHYGEPAWDPYARPPEPYSRPADPYARPPGPYSQPVDPHDGSAYPYAPPDNSPHPVQPDMNTQPKLVVADGTGRSHPLRRGSNIVGRGQEAALRLADTAVSREHIDVYFDGRIAIVHDLGSTNGTTVNGSAIQTWQLADGDEIRLGTSTVVFSAR
ncbi:MAG: FhaA domain-containing protein [Nakamurella sp.]